MGQLAHIYSHIDLTPFSVRELWSEHWPARLITCQVLSHSWLPCYTVCPFRKFSTFGPVWEPTYWVLGTYQLYTYFVKSFEEGGGGVTFALVSAVITVTQYTKCILRGGSTIYISRAGLFVIELTQCALQHEHCGSSKSVTHDACTVPFD